MYYEYEHQNSSVGWKSKDMSMYRIAMPKEKYHLLFSAFDK